MTSSAKALSVLSTHFNSHAHVERDADLYDTWDKLQISTHTLTWSVTFVASALPMANGYFNSHAHVERDPLRSAWLLAHPHFNSHAHVERDESIGI